MIAVEKLAPSEADASLETCTALRKLNSSQWVWKEPSPAAVLLCLKSVEMVQSGPVCPCSQTCDSETPRTWLQRTKVANSLWAIRSPGFARTGHHLGVCLPQWEAGQSYNCFSLARHKGLLGRLTACFSQSPKVSGLMELVVNLPGLDHSLWFHPWREWGIYSYAQSNIMQDLAHSRLVGASTRTLTELMLLKWLHKKSLRNELHASF